jgi:hypothetical protein
MSTVRLRPEDLERLGPAAREAVARALAEHVGLPVQVGDVRVDPAPAPAAQDTDQRAEDAEQEEQEEQEAPRHPGRTLATIGIGAAMVMSLIAGGVLGLVTTPHGPGLNVAQGGPVPSSQAPAPIPDPTSASAAAPEAASATPAAAPAATPSSTASSPAPAMPETPESSTQTQTPARPATHAPADPGTGTAPSTAAATPSPTTCILSSGSTVWTCLPFQVEIPSGPDAVCPPPLTGTITGPGNRIPLRVTVLGPSGGAGVRVFLDTGGMHTTLPASTLLGLGFRPVGSEIEAGIVPRSTQTVQVFRIPGEDFWVQDNGRPVPLATGTLTVFGSPAATFLTLGPDLLKHGVALSASDGAWSLTPACSRP